MAEVDKAQELYSKSKANKEVQKELHPLAMWSFILSIAPFIGFVLYFFIPFLIILIPISFIVSFIFGVIALFKVSDNKKRYYGKGFAISGIIISSLSLFIGIAAFIGFIYAFGYNFT